MRLCFKYKDCKNFDKTIRSNFNLWSLSVNPPKQFIFYDKVTITLKTVLWGLRMYRFFLINIHDYERFKLLKLR